MSNINHLGRGSLTDPFFYKGEWVQIDWCSQGIAGMNLLVDITTHNGRALDNYREAIRKRNTLPISKEKLLKLAGIDPGPQSDSLKVDTNAPNP